MYGRLLAVLILLLSASSAWADSPGWRTGKLADVEFKVRLIRDAKEMKSLFGSDLDREFIVMEMEVRPLYNSSIQLTRDDFLLRSYRDNDSSLAQSPSRIAGSSVLVMGTGRTTSGGGIFSESREPVLVGGAPGTGSRPRTLGSPSNVGIGGSTTSTTSIEVAEDQRPSGSLLERLDQMELPLGETQVPVKGYLYFQMNPKQKPKNLLLTYDGSAGECKIRFKK